MEKGVWGSLQIPARLGRAKRGRPIRAAWIIRVPGEDCILTLGWEDGRGLGSGSWSRLRPQLGREGRPTPVLGRSAWPGTLPCPSSRGWGQQRPGRHWQIGALIWLLASGSGELALSVQGRPLRVSHPVP